MTEKPKQAAFEAKVAGLIEVTRRLDVPQILALRRLTIDDPESRRWASAHQLTVVFTVLISKALERQPAARLQEARERNFETLLPPGPNREDDRRILSEIAAKIGPSRVNSEVELTQATFQALMAQMRVPDGPVARKREAAAEPPPLFAAQIDGRPVERDDGGAGDDEGPTQDFATIFDEALLTHVGDILKLLQPERPAAGQRLPFLCAPEFAAIYDECLRRFVLPQMRQSRHLQALATTYNWAELGRAKVVEIIQSGEINNPILHNWDIRWEALRPPKAVAKGKKARADDDNPWPLLREDARASGYEPPSDEDFPILRDLIRWDRETIAEAWREFGQLFKLEYPSGRHDLTREGTFRDGIGKWAALLPEPVVEHLVIKAYLTFPGSDLSFLQGLAGAFGGSTQERRRNAPFLCAFAHSQGQ